MRLKLTIMALRICSTALIVCMQVAELSAERNYAVANKQQAAEAAATLEAEAAGLLEQKKQAVTALQSQISQLKVRPQPTLLRNTYHI